MPKEAIRARIKAKLIRIYGEDRASTIFDPLFELIDNSTQPEQEHSELSEVDSILITYGDQVRREGEAPLQTLHHFLNETIKGVINTVHILPFYPYSSDDGFSVIDYYAVNPSFGSWADVRALSDDFKLMFDAVFNHISAQSDWFKAFLAGQAPYDEYFISVPPETDLSDVVRPRALPLLTPFQTANGEKHVWTTFSADQIDLNFDNPQLLLDVIRVLLFYVEQGASLIRLDAIAFLWKVPGTTSIHLEETHLIIQLMRDVLDIVAPQVVVITETNVPHEENISYFGDGTNEAQMVYNFALPPLVLHTLRTGNASKLSEWATTLKQVGERTTFFNFTASHDGVGLRPATGLLNQKDVDALVEMVKAHGGLVSYRSQSDGSQVPYELNITYFDAITAPDVTANEPDVAVKRFIVSQAIALALMGVPGVYFHSLFGSRNYKAGVEQTGHNRTINREKLNADELQAALEDKNSLRAKVFRAYRKLLKARAGESAFHPFGKQQIINLTSELFTVQRTSPDGSETIIALHNITGKAVLVDVPTAKVEIWKDVLSEEEYTSYESTVQIVMEPYQVLWLKAY